MNTIAAQIDHTTDILRATNDLLEARANHRALQNNGSSIHAVIDAQVKVLKAELALKDLIEPADYIAPELPLERMELKTDETFPARQKRMTADERADDPRRGQGTR